MEQSSCPVENAVQTPFTLKAHAMAFVEADMQGLPAEPLLPTDSLSLEELKCEADSMMALATFLITRNLGQSEAHQQVLATHLIENTPEDSHVLETLLHNKVDVIKAFLIKDFRELRDSGRSDDLFDRLEHYRQAYYERSPQAEGIEAHYVSSENMLMTGVSTTTERFALLLHSFDIAANQASLSKRQKIQLAHESEHLPALLAKISIDDESRFVDLMNDHEFLSSALVKVTDHEAGPRATFDQRIIAKMRQLYPEEKTQYDHRGHLGCPASVSFDGHSSAISELWHLTVEALEKCGFWGDSEAHVPRGLVAGPDANK